MSFQPDFITDRTNRQTGKFETIRQLAKRHMMDQYHTTTDEELKNAVVELDLPLEWGSCNTSEEPATTDRG